MIACYDLQNCPASYDAIGFILQVEAERLRRGDPDVEIVILPGPADGFRADNFWPRKVSERRALLDGVVIPMFNMLPSCRRVTFEADRAAVAADTLGRGIGLYGMRRIVDGLARAGRPLRSKQSATPYPQLVTITLRECEHHPERNSDVTEWIAAAQVIKARGYHVVFVRDTLRADEAIEGFSTDGPAARDLDLRAWLYSAALCNLFVSNGPAWFSIALDAPTLIMKPTTEELGRVYSAAYFEKCGIPWRQQLPRCPPYQRIVWKPDAREDIVEAFAAFVESC